MSTAQSRVKSIGYWVVFVAIVALYVYALATAIGNWLGMSNIANILADGLSPSGILWLSVGVAIPVVTFIVASIVARGKLRWQRVLILLLGLTIVAVLQLDLMHMVPTTRYLE